MIYLDHAATSMHKPPQVAEAMLQALKTCASIGRSGHEAARNAAEIAYNCRVRAAEFFDAAPEQVVFTANATHGLNIAIQSVVQPGDRVVVSGFEHNAVLRPLHHLGAKIVPSGQRLFDPQDTLNAFSAAITLQTKAVICTHVSNVFGYILPVEAIAELCMARNVPFILDASQSAGVLPVSLKQLGASFIAMPGHKSLLGPQGTGLLLCGRTPKPLLFGGTGSNSLDPSMPPFLPDIAETGTHNVPGIAGLLASLTCLQQKGIASVQTKERQLMQYLQNTISQLPQIQSFFGEAGTQSGVLSFQISHMDCEAAAQKLAEKEIAVRAGLHCAPLAHKSAGTLEKGTVRVSVSDKNTREEIDLLIGALKDMIR